MITATASAVPVTILTGFLGSGKTTLLNQLLKLPNLADTAVIINEFGEVGLDHLLIEQAFENTVLLKNGCICCTVRGDISDTLETLFIRAQNGEIPNFSRIVIETTGIADPGPVSHALVTEVNGRYNCRLDGIVTTVDVKHILNQLAAQYEARNQIAFADRILLTKCDLATAPEITRAEHAIRTLNQHAPIKATLHGALQPTDIFGLSPNNNATDDRIAQWLAHSPHTHNHHHAHHHDDISTTLITTPKPVPQAALEQWLDSILSLRGADILRLKGIVHLTNANRPLLLQAVHHVIHPCRWLEPKPALPKQTEIVVITRGISSEALKASFAICVEK
jgi:G3E family GTPase